MTTTRTNANTRLPSIEERWNETNFHTMAELWNLSERDRTRMRQLQHCLQDIDHWKNDPFEVIRFFKAHHGRVVRAERAFRQVIQWRHDQQMDTYLQRYGTPDPLFPQYWPIAVLNTTDQDRDPILVERFGATDYAGFLEEFGSDQCLDYSALFVRELIEQRSFWDCYEEHVGRRVRQFTLIVDLEGGGLEFLRPTMIRYLQRLSHITQVYYPGWAKRIILCRAPRVFKYGSAAIKPLLSKEVQNKLVFTNSSDYLEVIKDYIALHNLPHCLYNKGLALGMPGFFEKTNLRGGKLEDAPDELRKISFTSTTTAATECHSYRDNDDEGGDATDSFLGEWSERTNVSVLVLAKGAWSEPPERRILQRSHP